jgi:hypothetical protein
MPLTPTSTNDGIVLTDLSVAIVDPLTPDPGRSVLISNLRRKQALWDGNRRGNPNGTIGRLPRG